MKQYLKVFNKRNLIINRRAQLSLLVFIYLFALFFHVGLLMAAASWQNDPFSVGAIVVFFAVVGVIAASFCVLLLASNRVFGPIYRLQKSLEDLANGKEAKPINFRKGDYFQEVCQEYNRMLPRIPPGTTAPNTIVNTEV